MFISPTRQQQCFPTNLIRKRDLKSIIRYTSPRKPNFLVINNISYRLWHNIEIDMNKSSVQQKYTQKSGDSTGLKLVGLFLRGIGQTICRFSQSTVVQWLLRQLRIHVPRLFKQIVVVKVKICLHRVRVGFCSRPAFRL